MKKYCIILLLALMLMTGCSYVNVSDESKTNYLNYKAELQEQKEFNNGEDLPFDIMFSLDQVGEEKISYRVVLDNPREDVTDIKALVIHNYMTEDVFPSIGIFDNPVDLLVNSKDTRGIVLVGYINTLETVETLDIDVRVLIEYNISGNNNKIYYKMTK